MAKVSGLPSKNPEEAFVAGAQWPRGKVVLAEDGGFGQGPGYAETWGGIIPIILSHRPPSPAQVMDNFDIGQTISHIPLISLLTEGQILSIPSRGGKSFSFLTVAPKQWKGEHRQIQFHTDTSYATTLRRQRGQFGI